MAAADEAIAAGRPYCIARIDVGSDVKALTEAAAAINAKHGSVAAMLWSADQGKAKARREAGHALPWFIIRTIF